MKQQECNVLKSENSGLADENSRYRSLIQTLLRHPSFTPFIEDLSKDPSVMSLQSNAPQPQPQQQQQSQNKQQQRAHTPLPPQAQQSSSQSFPSFNTMPPKQETQHINMTMIPETPVDLSNLNLNNGGSNMPFNHQRPAGYNVSRGPSPFDLSMEGAKQPRRRSDIPSWETNPQSFGFNQ